MFAALSADAEANVRSRDGRTHAVVDTLGSTIAFSLIGGQTYDLAGADALLPSLATHSLIVDHSNNAEARVLATLSEVGAQAVIPSRRRRQALRDYDRALYAARHLAENFFSKLNHYNPLRQDPAQFSGGYARSGDGYPAQQTITGRLRPLPVRGRRSTNSRL